MFNRIYYDSSNALVTATITIDEPLLVGGHAECSCRLVVKGHDIDYDVTLVGIDQIQAFENAVMILHALENKENLAFEADTPTDR